MDIHPIPPKLWGSLEDRKPTDKTPKIPSEPGKSWDVTLVPSSFLTQYSLRISGTENYTTTTPRQKSEILETWALQKRVLPGARVKLELLTRRVSWAGGAEGERSHSGRPVSYDTIFLLARDDLWTSRSMKNGFFHRCDTEKLYEICFSVMILNGTQ